MGNLGLKPI